MSTTLAELVKGTHVMAEQLHVEMVDDLDGSSADQTVPFELDGRSYEIDLSDDNANALRGELRRYIGVARRVGGRKIRVALGQSTIDSGAGVLLFADRERKQAHTE